MSPLVPALLAVSTTWTLLGTLALARTRARRAPATSAASAPPVSVLKPLAGADPSLKDNLRTFFEQDHEGMELVFGAERADDPGLAVARALAAAYPTVRTKVVVTGGLRGENPKVRNLRGMLPHASHDLILVSDSNVRAPRHYVREAATIKASDPRVGLVTHTFVGVGGGSLGAHLECVQLTGFVAAGAALPSALGDAAVIGKSMLMSRRQLASLGGLERVADVLAEDYTIGKMYQRGGLRVAVAPTVLENVVGSSSLRGMFDRQLRWSMMRYRLRPLTFLAEPITNPLVMLPWALQLFGGAAGLAWLCAMWLVRDVASWLLLRGRRGAWAPLALSGLRDALMLLVWLATPLSRHISWRGHRVRLGAGTLIFACGPSLEAPSDPAATWRQSRGR